MYNYIIYIYNYVAAAASELAKKFRSETKVLLKLLKRFCKQT